MRCVVTEQEGRIVASITAPDTDNWILRPFRLVRANRNLLLCSLAVVLLFCVQAVSVFGTMRMIARYQDATHIQTFLLHLNNLMFLASGAVAAQRGYEITGDDIFLERYREAVGRVDGELKQLQTTAEGFPVRKRYLDFLDQDTRALLALLDDAIEARRGRPQQSATARLALEEGRNIMTRILDSAGQLSALEKTRFDTETRSVTRDLQWLSIAVLTGTLISLITGAAGLYLIILAARRQQDEQSLQAAKERAEYANREKTRFLANLSHEIRTPLNAILGFSEILRELASNPRERRYVEIILGNGESLATLINDVLDLARIEVGKLKLRPEPTDLRVLARGWRTLFAQQVAQKEKNIEMRVYVDESVPERLDVDPLRLRQIVLNLVGNAIKFTDEGHIHVRMWCELDSADHAYATLKLSVDDSGAGIPSDRVRKIFKPFNQAGLMLDREQEGAGLGLSIVLNLVRLMNGSIEVDSEVGRGSRFTVTLRALPVAVSAKVADGAVAGIAAETALAPLTILIADDNQTNRELIGTYLRAARHRLLFAEDGREAVDIARRERPDIILMDIRMPVMDGRAARSVIAEDPGLRHIPVIAVTASALSDDTQELRARFDGYVRKPFTGQQLLAEIARVLNLGVPAPEAAQEAPGDEEKGSSTVRADLLSGWQALLERLQTDAGTRVPELRAAMAMGEISEFAYELRTLGDRAGCTPVVRYANRLAAHAEGFELAALERGLEGFPALVAAVEAAIARGGG
jgi:signal transduction histidine kinase/DNA-binding NarL/FixJ family response regulator